MGILGLTLQSAPTHDRALVDRCAEVPVAVAADAMGRLRAFDPELRLVSGSRLVGPAYTVRVPPGDNLAFHYALDNAAPGDVIVVDGQGGRSNALCGEIMARYALSRGIAGFVIDGFVRDVAVLRQLGFPVVARGTQPNGPYKHGPGETNCSVVIGGQPVEPGDVMIADDDGALAIRPHEVDAMLQSADAQAAAEAKMVEAIERGEFDRSWVSSQMRAAGYRLPDGGGQ